MKDITPNVRENASQTNSGAEPGPEPLSWGKTSSSSGTEPDMAAQSYNRFLGGSPASVFIRLIFISLIVGALLMWLDIRPYDIIRGFKRMIDGILHLGFDAVEMIFQYILAGAAIVVPVGLIIRLLNYRSER